MRPFAFALPLLAATAVFAQTPAANPTVINATSSFTVPNGMAACPVGMSAQQASSGQTMWTISLEDAHQPKSEAELRASNYGVHVEIDAAKDKASRQIEINAAENKAIRQVELAVYFLPPGTRALPLHSSVGGADTANSKKTFTLSASDHASLKLAGDLLVGPAASITRVRLLSITYADGTSWHTRSSNSCSIEPNRVIPVGAQ